MGVRGLDRQGYTEGMGKRDKTLVKISADDLQTVCPWHGPVGDVPYEAQDPAPCGCQWVLSPDDGLLHAVQVDESLRLEAT